MKTFTITIRAEMDTDGIVPKEPSAKKRAEEVGRVTREIAAGLSEQGGELAKLCVAAGLRVQHASLTIEELAPAGSHGKSSVERIHLGVPQEPPAVSETAPPPGTSRTGQTTANTGTLAG